jgi:hypothetical protein
MNKLFGIISAIMLLNCSLIEPCYLAIENNSDYSIRAKFKENIENELIISSKKGDFILCRPGEIEFSISIDEIKYFTEVKISLDYMEKKKFEFSLKEAE